MGFLNSAINTLRDGRTFGVGSYMRHFTASEISINVPNVGPVRIRGKNSDFETLKQVFLHREYDTSFCGELDARINRKYEDMIAEGRKPIIVDAGANIGAASLWFASRYPNASIVALEPDANNSRMLRANVAHYPMIHVIDAAIGSEVGYVTTNEGEGEPGWATQTQRASNGKPVLSMQEAFRRSGGDDPFIVKIDIEGFEADLFASNLDWLANTHVLMIEPHDWMLPGKLSSRTFQKALAQHDFELFIRGENLLYARI